MEFTITKTFDDIKIMMKLRTGVIIPTNYDISEAT